MQTVHRVALATYEELPQLSPDDQSLIEPLRELGVDPQPVVWNDPRADWRAYSAVVIRSCWDYHRRHDEFLHWIGTLEAQAIRVWNSPPLVRWNSDKRYLLDLAQDGIATVESVLVPRGDTRPLEVLMRQRGWTRVVVKPCVSASAHDTWLSAGAADADEQRFRASVSRADVLVQPYVDAIAKDGEWSLVFLGGEFSHAALKRPAAGDFRVQTEHGGSFETRVAPGALIASAHRVLRRVHETRGETLYARVDGYVNDGELVLMELELIEPMLFLRLDADAALRLASVIAVLLGRPA